MSLVSAEQPTVSNPEVTVLMAVYNGREYVREAIESVLGQTFTNLEFIIINDGSTDGSRETILSYTDPRIRFLDNPENIGLTRSLNRGLKKALGTWIVRADVDDWNDPDRVTRQVEFANTRKLDVCFCDIRVTPDRNRAYILRFSGQPLPAVKWNGLFYNAYGGHPASCYRREAILNLGGYDEKYRFAQDYELWDRCDEAGLAFGYVPAALVRRRIHAGCIARQYHAGQVQTIEAVSLRAMRRILSDLSEPDATSVRWLLQGNAAAPAAGSLAVGFSLCRKFIHSYLDSRTLPGERPVIWAAVAASMHYRFRKLATRRDLLKACWLWLEAVARARGRYRLPVKQTVAWSLGRNEET
jgi:hypothetical protein